MNTPPNLEQWLRDTVARLVLHAPENRLSDFQNGPVFDSPLVGVADGDDSIFGLFRRVVSPDHLGPRDLLSRHSRPEADLNTVRVISWVLPFCTQIRRSNRNQDWPSALYSIARNNGGALNWKISRRLTAILQKRGFAAVAPRLTGEYDTFRSLEHTFSSSWSERHIAYAAGLGLFGLNGCLITPRGAMVRLGSLVTNLPVCVTPRNASDHRAPCLRDGGNTCGLCLERCPADALAGSGLDKSKCYARRQAIRQRFLDAYSIQFRMLPAPIVKSGRRELGLSLGCALCASGVPCEASDTALNGEA
jgi:epoxyqueuosine reductase